MSITVGETILNKYRILELIGEGGMARVWLAEEITLGDRKVAIKEPRADLSPFLQEEVLSRFERELRVCAKLDEANTPHIVRAITAAPYEDRALLVMQYMPGGDLAALLRKHPTGLPLDRAMEITLAVLRALQDAHEHPLEIIHRDIKPANILFDARGVAYLGDFGLAQISGGTDDLTRLRGGTVMGTSLYAAPEQEAGRGYLTAAADLYSLGCVLFEMLTGKRYKRLQLGTKASSLRPDVPEWLDNVLSQALAEDPWTRCQTAKELIEALEANWVPSRIEPDVRPRRIDFGAVAYGEQPRSSIHITNRGGATLRGTARTMNDWLVLLTPTGQPLHNSRSAALSIQPGEDATIYLAMDSCQIPTQGRYSGAVRIEIDDAHFPEQLSVPVTVRVAPPFLLDPKDAGSAIHSKDELWRYCDRYWNRATEYLAQGRLEACLRFMGETNLVQKASALQNERNPNVGLEMLLRACGAPQPEICETNLAEIEHQLHPRKFWKQNRLVFRIAHKGSRGYLYGYLEPHPDAKAWLKVPQPYFGCHPGETAEVEIHVTHGRRTHRLFSWSERWLTLRIL